MENAELITVDELVECIERYVREDTYVVHVDDNKSSKAGANAPDVKNKEKNVGAEDRKSAPKVSNRFHMSIEEDIWSRGLQKKWVEPQDISQRDELIERRQAARILHEFLKRERLEPDLPDWESAKSLLDLYDCRVCVNHVAQVYSKGIMDGITEHVFGMREGVLREELEPMVERLFDRKKRHTRNLV